METGAPLQSCFLPRIHDQATMCEQVHYCNAIVMNCFATIQGVFFALFHINGIELEGSALY